MKTISKILNIIFILILAVSCNDANQVDYIKPVEITMEGVGADNIVQIEEGVTSYTAKINITSTKGIYSFSLYELDPKTGAIGNIIGEKTIFTPSVSTYSYEYVIDGLSTNKGIQVIIEDDDLNTYSKNLVVKILPVVLVSDVKSIETAEVYIGPYYASWYSGRCYMRGNGAAYSNEIDFSLGNVDIDGTVVPAFVSPDKRQEKGLLYLPNLRSCTFGLTTLTKAQFDAISLTSSVAIDTISTPTLDVIGAVNAKVYVYENSTEKGLIYISSLANKTATLEQPDGNWVVNSKYNELKIQTKTVMKK